MDREQRAQRQREIDANAVDPPQVSTIIVSRRIEIPDMVRVDRCHRLPEYGPKLLFLSGGSALRNLSEVLKHYTHNSIHLITPFDSGGSSAEIRRKFNMLSIGDVRNRLMALSDESALNYNPEVSALFSYRLSANDSLLARMEFEEILNGQHERIANVSLPMRGIFLSHLRWFASRMPTDFDLCGASLGNLIITGCFLEHDRDIVIAIFLIWKLLGVSGIVRPITGANLHIRAHYEDGSVEIGQHKLGKKNHSGVLRKITNIDLVESLDDSSTVECETCHIDGVCSELLATADIICFPMGSFFGSVMVNLLPKGVGRAIVQRHCPKVYIPNTRSDPEMHGYTLVECIHWIIQMTRRDTGEETRANEILTIVLVDTMNCDYCVEIDKSTIEHNMGISVLDVPLVQPHHNGELAKRLDPTKVAEVLLTLGS